MDVAHNDGNSHQDANMSMPTKTKVTAFDKADYIELLDASRASMRESMREILEWASRLDVHAASACAGLDPFLDLFPAYSNSEYCRINLDILRSKARHGTLGISIKSSTQRVDISKLSPAQLVKTMKGVCSEVEARQHAKSIAEFDKFSARLAGLKFLGVEFPDTDMKGYPVKLQWYKAAGEYGRLCLPLLEAACKDFIELSDQLDQAMFEFNASMGAVRFRAIRCTYSLDAFDKLGPAKPEMKIVTSYQSVSKKRRYNSVRDFKKDLRRKRCKRVLTGELGRAPTVDEVKMAMAKVRAKEPSPWITSEVMSACCMGRKKKVLFEMQSNFVAVMEPWAVLRGNLQALL